MGAEGYFTHVAPWSAVCVATILVSPDTASVQGTPSVSLSALLLVLLGGGTAISMVVDKDLLLNHPTRRRIYEHLRLLPGDHFRSIARSLGMSLGTLRHHLDTLVRLGLVRRHDAKGKARYYPIGRSVEADVNHLYQQHWDFRDLRVRVLFAVRQSEAAGPSQVGKTLGISRQLAAYHLACLEEAGYLCREGNRYRAIDAPVAPTRR